MSHIMPGPRLFFIGIVVIVAATALLLYFARDKGVDIGGVLINPNAAVQEDKTYELYLWDEQLIIPWAPKTQSEMLIDGIRQFQRMRPNVSVTYTIVPREEAAATLATAIESGQPPDVYGTAAGAVYYPDLQVPATPYLPERRSEVGPLFAPAAAEPLSADGYLWGWPRGLWWHTWVANRAFIRGAADNKAVNDGPTWTWEQFPARLADGAPAVDTSSVIVLEQLMAAAGAPGYTDASGSLTWNETLLHDVARFVRTWHPPSDNGAARTRVERLLTGDSPLIGPVGPHLAQTILRHTPDTYTLVPPPHRPPAPPVIPVEVSAYFVFRREPHEGDDHTRVATELAAFLASHAQRWLIQAAGLLPVDDEGLAYWRDAAPLDELSKQTLTHHPGSAGSLTETMSRQRWREAVQPHWEAFVRGATEPDRFAADSLRVLREQLAPEGGPSGSDSD